MALAHLRQRLSERPCQFQRSQSGNSIKSFTFHLTTDLVRVTKDVDFIHELVQFSNILANADIDCIFTDVEDVRKGMVALHDERRHLGKFWMLSELGPVALSVLLHRYGGAQPLIYD